jgi:murein DD-endopeptidase MepM/ murein hydrolase activator NlpD
MASKWQAFKEQISEPYRVTVKREETFEEVKVYNVNKANLWALAIGVVLTVALLTFALIALTPLRTLLPGFGALNERRELVDLNRQLREIEETVNAQEAYTTNVQRILVGDVETYDEVAEANAEAIPDSAIHTERIPEDEELRQEVASAKTRYQSNTNSGGVPLDQLHLVAPLLGTISSPFDPTDRHFGIDIVAPSETPIKATLDGYVVEAGWSPENGNVVGIQHAGDLLTFYKHNSSVLKRVGDFVKAGEAIAIIGNTGTRTDGPHLHFELWYRGQPVNPVGFVAFQ